MESSLAKTKTLSTIGISFNIAASKLGFIDGAPDGTRDFKCADGFENMIIPIKHKRQCIYISAPSGAGKTYFCANYAKLYHNTYPNARVMYISRVRDDPTLESIKDFLLMVNLATTDFNTIVNDEIKNALIIFDDTDTLKGEVFNQVKAFRERLLETGRHASTSVIITTHTFSDYANTRKIFPEIHVFVLFTTVNWNKSLCAALLRYVSLSQDIIRRIYYYLPVNRWVAIFTNFPRAYTERLISLMETIVRTVSWSFDMSAKLFQ